MSKLSTTPPWRFPVQIDWIEGATRPADSAPMPKSRLCGVQVEEGKGRAYAAMVAARAAKIGVPCPADKDQGPVSWPAHEYQLRSATFLLETPGAALFLDPGLGKTSITLAAISALKTARNFKRALVVAPLRPAQLTWPNEVVKWQDFKDLKLNVLHGPKKALKVLRSQFDTLAWLFKQFTPKTWPWDVLVIDESTMFKSWSAQRTKLVKSVAGSFSRRWILTGTPAPQGVVDLFAQIYLLDGGARLGKFIYEFRRRFMVQTGYMGYEWKPKDGALEEVMNSITDIVMRLDAKDYLKLPPLTYNDIEVELPPSARAAYKELEDVFVTKLNTGTVTAASAGILAQKLRQATNGAIYGEDGKVHVLHHAKEEALEELIEELAGQPLLVAVAYLSEVELLRQRFGDDVPYLGGGVKKAEADAIIAKWNRGETPLLLAHPTSVSKGLNLQSACSHMCWYGLTWNLEEYIQMINRIYRQGQKNRVVVHTLVARNTYDQIISRALRVKGSTQKALLDGLKARGAK